MTDKINPIPVFFSCDDNYLPFLAVALRSLSENLSPDRTCDVHILNNGLDRERVRRILEMDLSNISIRLVDVGHAIAPIAEKLNLRDYYTASIYYRLFIPSMFPQYHKVIYLDADIAVTGNIAELYDTNLGNHLVGAVSDDIIASHRDFREYAERAVGVPFRRYFNSGVMLMNLDQFRMQSIERKFVYLLGKYHFDTVCPDQDYLNVLCRDQVLYLDKGWNKMSIDENYEGAPRLIHYNMYYKPWQYRRICYREFFWHYAEQTPFYGEIRAIQKAFGIKGRLMHTMQNRTLHKSARRISAQENNFRGVLQKVSLNTESDWMRVYEA